MNILQIIRWSPLCLLGFTLFASPVAAQVFNAGPSSESLFDVVINARTDSDIVSNFGSPASIGSDGLTTKLNFFDTVSVGDFATVSSGTEIIFGRGSSIGDSFTANPGSELIVDGGGSIGDFFTAFGCYIRIGNGSIGNHFTVENGSVVNIGSGNVGNFVTANSGSQVNIFGDGSVGSSFTANNGSEVNIDGGDVGNRFTVDNGGEVNITGGFFSGEFKAFNGGEINVSGGDFVLDGESLDDSLTIGDTFTIVQRNVTLSGRFANGVAFSFNLNSADSVGEDFFDPDATLTVTAVQEIPLLGDCNLDGVINFADIPTFLQILCCANYLNQADIDQSNMVDFADIPALIELLMTL